MAFGGDTLLIAAVLAGPAVVTAGLCLTLGRRIARRGRGLAVLVCGLAAPATLFAAGYLQYAATRNDPGDGAALALAGFVIVAALSVPLDLLVAGLMLWRRRGEAGLQVASRVSRSLGGSRS